MANVIIENIDGVEKTLQSDKEVLDFTRDIFDENEESDTLLKKPETAEDGLAYIQEYCDNLSILG